MRFSLAALTFASAAQAIDLLSLVDQYSSLIPSDASALGAYTSVTEPIIGAASSDVDYSSYYDELQSTMGIEAASSAIASVTATALSDASEHASHASSSVWSSSSANAPYGAWNSSSSSTTHVHSNSSNSSNKSSSSSSSSKAIGASQAPYVVGAALAGLSILML